MKPNSIHMHRKLCSFGRQVLKLAEFWVQMRFLFEEVEGCEINIYRKKVFPKHIYKGMPCLLSFRIIKYSV
jgi:hypothetical protein